MGASLTCVLSMVKRFHKQYGITELDYQSDSDFKLKP